MHGSAILLQVTRADVGRMLRSDALELALGVLLIGVGILAGALYARPIGRREPSLPWFGLFAFLYGLRSLARTDAFPLLFDVPAAFWLYLASAITYAVPLPAVLFLRAALPRWRGALGWIAGFLTAFVVCGVAADVIAGRPEAARVPNNLIALTFMVVVLAMLFRPGWPRSRDLRTLRIGLLSWAAMAVADNLRGLALVSWRGSDAEPLGAAVLFACLGTIAARRVFAGAQRLVAVDKELDIARGIQSSILPAAPPAAAGLAVAARYRPMTAVAGDFYEFLHAGDRQLGILVADVSGHGIPAALLASMVKVAIAAQKAHAPQPAAVLAGMNATLLGQLGGQYVTAAYLFLDREAGLFRYGAAGHPPLLYWPRGSDPREVEENGLPLGLMDIAQYGQVEHPLQAGDRFLLYTDGLVEAANAAGEHFAAERVRSAVAAGTGLSTDGVADLVLESARRWSGQTAADDLTLVLVDCV